MSKIPEDVIELCAALYQYQVANEDLIRISRDFRAQKQEEALLLGPQSDSNAVGFSYRQGLLSSQPEEALDLE